MTADGHCVSATGCNRSCQISRLAHRAVYNGVESANMLAYICGMHGHYMRGFNDRYEVKHD